MGPIEPIGVEPIGPSSPLPRPLRVSRDPREREPGDRRQPSHDAPDEPTPSEELDEDAGGHIDVTV